MRWQRRWRSEVEQPPHRRSQAGFPVLDREFSRALEAGRGHGTTRLGDRSCESKEREHVVGRRVGGCCLRTEPGTVTKPHPTLRIDVDVYRMDWAVPPTGRMPRGYGKSHPDDQRDDLAIGEPPEPQLVEPTVCHQPRVRQTPQPGAQSTGRFAAGPRFAPVR